MELKIKEHMKYALACVTSMGVRITPADRMAVQNSTRFTMQATSAETNVLNVAASLGKPCLALTRFVEGSPIAAFIKAQLRARNIAFVGPEVPQGGPWGWRHQFNIADSGFALMRASSKTNDWKLNFGDIALMWRVDAPRGEFFHTNWTGCGATASGSCHA